MKLIETRPLPLPGAYVVRFGRFPDHRGYFTEQFRRSDFDRIDCLSGVPLVQANESFSRPGTIRGMHFQWNPYMGKLVRTVHGRMVDLMVDIRKGSPTFGQMIAVDLPSKPDQDYAEWVWVPPGFAHGNYFTEETLIEYFCSGEYSSGCEAGICPMADDIDWSACDPPLKTEFDEIASSSPLMADKDRDAMTIGEWTSDERSDQFIYGKC